MLTLDAALRIPGQVVFTTVEQDAVLLNTLTNTYYSLNEVGARFWNLLAAGKTLREAYRTLLEEFAVESSRLEQDLLELAGHLLTNGLVEIAEAQDVNCTIEL